MRKFAELEERDFEKIYRFLALMSILCIVLAWVLPLSAPIAEISAVISPGSMWIGALAAPAIFVIVVLAYTCGYFLQSLISCRGRFKRRADTSTYEAQTRFFSSRIAFPSLVILATIHLALGIASHTVLYELLEPMYHGLLFYVALIFILSFASSIVGVVMWFLPLGRILSYKTVASGAFIIMIAAWVYGVYGGFGGVSGLYGAILIAIYAVLAAVVINQTHLSKSYHGTIVSRITNSARGYNLLLVALLIPIAAIAFFIAAVVFTGLKIAFRSLLFYFFGNVAQNSEQGSMIDEMGLTKAYNMFVYDVPDATMSYEFYLAVIFAILCVGVIIFLVVCRTEQMKIIIGKIKKWISDVLDFLFSLFDPSSEIRTGKTYVFESYKDVEKKIKHRGDVGSARIHDPEHSYRAFLAHLEALPEGEKRVRYAYSTFAISLRHQGLGVKKSDTPRQIAQRISTDRRFEHISGITEAFEKVSYAERELSREDYEMTMNTLLPLVRSVLPHT